MDKFKTKKQKFDEDEISSNLNIESTSGVSNQASSSSTGLNKIRLYNPSNYVRNLICTVKEQYT